MARSNRRGTGPVKHMSTLVVIPTYQEAGNIEALLTHVRGSLPAADVLVVDDASPDGTAQVAEAAGARLGRVALLRRPGKTGLGNAYRAAFAWGLARPYDVIVTMDADLSHDPRALPALVGAVRDGADLAIGSRFVAGGATPGWGPHRRLLSRAGNAYAHALLGIDVRDATSGFRAYSADRLRAIGVDSLQARGYGTQVELAHRVARSGGRLAELPICFQDRRWGRSKVSPAVVAEALWLVTRLAFDGRLAPMHWSAEVGPSHIASSELG